MLSMLRRPDPPDAHPLSAYEAAVDPPVVLLERFECLRRRGEEQVGGDAVVELEELVQFLRHGEDDVEMRAVRQPLADLPGPLRLPRPEAVGAVAVAAGAGEPIGVAAILAADAVEAKWALATEGKQVEGRIRPLVESAGPEVSPVEKNAVDGEGYAVTVNSMKSPPQASNFVTLSPMF